MSIVKKLLLLFLVIVVVLVVIMFVTNTKSKQLSVVINEAEVSVEIVGSAPARAQGLSGRESLGESQGMFFVFEEADRHSFWMKDMLFAIDIIWIDENFKIVDINRSVLPESYPRVFQPSRPINFVLEVNAGWADTNNVSVGDVVTFPIEP